MKWHNSSYLVIGILAIIATVAVLGYQQLQLHHRQSMIHDRGSMVMPFNLSTTTHVFNKTDTGGVQRITVDKDGSDEDVSRIRSHLQSITEEFDKGNFSDPATLHGNQMPGLQTLQERHERLNVTYSEIDEGAKVAYRTQDTVVVNALHDWFDAQLRDHGPDAQPS